MWVPRSLACALDRQGRRQGLGADAGQNSWDFRGPAGASGEYAAIDLHAGLICLNGPVGMDLAMQMELFEVALDDLDADPDLVNRVLEVTLENAGDEEIRIVRYALP
jgi:hypothetical protein